MSDLEKEKKAAASAAASAVQEAMLIGLGSGSTVRYFIEALGARCKNGLNIKAVASSKESEALAKSAGIPLISIDMVTQLDLTVDGADLIDAKWRMIKGGGGALLREKILASISRHVIIITDSSKQVSDFPKEALLPVEITPFGQRATIASINRSGFSGTLRIQGSRPYLTDNQNLIFDLHLEGSNAELAHEKLKKIPGVIETGLFLNLVNELITGLPDGSAKRVQCKN